MCIGEKLLIFVFQPTFDEFSYLQEIVCNGLFCLYNEVDAIKLFTLHKNMHWFTFQSLLLLLLIYLKLTNIYNRSIKV